MKDSLLPVVKEESDLPGQHFIGVAVGEEVVVVFDGFTSFQPVQELFHPGDIFAENRRKPKDAEPTSQGGPHHLFAGGFESTVFAFGYG